MTLPLHGLRVLEFTHAVLGPACGLTLADLGAEVIKIEKTPDGDDTRRLKGFGQGYYPFFNRNKKSLALDIKSEAGREIVYQLVKTADIVIENFAPGTMERLGYGYLPLSALHPPLVYCSLKGFLPGPYEQRLALDEVVQMMSGLAYMTGPPGQPLRAGASIIDIMGGVYGALGILVALRDREQTGKGQLVQGALFETAAFVMGHHMAYAALAGRPVPPMPARVSAWAIYRAFQTREGDFVFVGVTSDKQWQKFCQVFERPEWLTDERLTSNNDRIAQRDWLLPALEALFADLAKAEAIRKCDQAGIPFSPIARPEDLFDDPQLNSNGTLLETTLPGGVTTKLPRLPVLVGEQKWALRADPPRAGEHTHELLRELGYADNDLDTLTRARVISGAHP